MRRTASTGEGRSGGRRAGRRQKSGEKVFYYKGCVKEKGKKARTQTGREAPLLMQNPSRCPATPSIQRNTQRNTEEPPRLSSTPIILPHTHLADTKLVPNLSD